MAEVAAAAVYMASHRYAESGLSIHGGGQAGTNDTSWRRRRQWRSTMGGQLRRWRRWTRIGGRLQM